MANNRQTAQTSYPFKPSPTGLNPLLSGLKDICLLLNTQKITLPFTGNYTLGERASYLYSIIVNNSNCVYTFCSVEFSDASENLGRLTVFTVPRNLGVIRVAEGNSWLLVDSNQLPTSNGTYILTPPEIVEPCQVKWLTFKTNYLRFYNEYRHHNPLERQNLPPDTLVKEFTGSNNTVKLKDGYNCSLRYEPETETLFITGGIGAGLGLPKTIPWNTQAPDVNTGVITINRIGYSSSSDTGVKNIDIITGENVQLTYDNAELIFTIKK